MFYFTSKIPTPEQTIDLVAIHGLKGHYDETWTDKNTTQNWLRDFLPTQAPQLRIISWGYNSQVLGSTSMGNITTFAQSLLVDLKACRGTQALAKRPLIFVCHSLGGLVFKSESMYFHILSWVSVLIQDRCLLSHMKERNYTKQRSTQSKMSCFWELLMPDRILRRR